MVTPQYSIKNSLFQKYKNRFWISWNLIIRLYSNIVHLFYTFIKFISLQKIVINSC